MSTKRLEQIYDGDNADPDPNSRTYMALIY